VAQDEVGRAVDVHAPSMTGADGRHTGA
jgi:hypothetical protein